MKELEFDWDENKNKENDGLIRLISARKATKNEREIYERW